MYKIDHNFFEKTKKQNGQNVVYWRVRFKYGVKISDKKSQN